MGEIPVWHGGKKCHDCWEMNHFGKSTMCLNPQRERVPTKKGKRDHLAGSLYLGSVETELVQIDKVQFDKGRDTWEINLSAKFGPIRFKIDTGAEVSVIKGLVPRKNQKFEIHIFLFIRKSYVILQKTA